MNKLACVLAAGLAATAVGADAAVVPASVVQDVTSGIQDPGANADRYVAGNALGAADGAFYSLGLGGDITLGFGRTFSGRTEIRVTEVTHAFVKLDRYREAVDVFAVDGGAETLVGRIVNADALSGAALSYAGRFDALRLADVTGTAFAGSPSADGFDLDAVEVSAIAPVPLPASGLALATAFGLAAALRRRR
jgi:hypothetical protein